MPITVDRWNKEGNANRSCKKCFQNAIGDENHYIFSCDYFSAHRAKYLPTFVGGTDNFKAAWNTILSFDGSDLVNLAKFICHITSNFEYDSTDKIDTENDWHKIKRNRVSRAGRILKPNTKFT